MSNLDLDRIEEINELILAYASGRFERKVSVSPKRDVMDSVVVGINMLGEELMATTISRDYFSSIYNAVSDMLFVITHEGIIDNVNKAVSVTLGLDLNAVIDTPINDYVDPHGAVFFQYIKEELKSDRESIIFETNFKNKAGDPIPVSCSCAKIKDRSDDINGYVLAVQDITERKRTEQVVLRAIVDTQEKEQKRVASDLHDSLGQQLSAVKLFLNALDEHMVNTDKEAIFGHCKGILDNAIDNLRSICFNLMPGTLELAGLELAIKEMVDKLGKQDLIDFHFKSTSRVPRVIKPIEFALYRICQEFINNTLKHAKAKNIYIRLSGTSEYIKLELKDDGCGFNLKKQQSSDGKGLDNMTSRARAFEGTCKLSSKSGKGTTLTAIIPTKLNGNEKD
jgi:PAS domain S-box-containing protein